MNKLIYFSVFLFLLQASDLFGQSLLDGTSYQASIFNLPDNIGAVRLTNTADSDCDSELGTPVGNDAATDACLVDDSGVAPVEVTFNSGPQAIGNVLLTSTAVTYDGRSQPITTFNASNDVTADAVAWTTSGDLLEFTLTTADNTFPSPDDEDFWGFAAENIQYPNATADSTVGLPFDEELDTYVNSYFWFETEEGTAVDGYEVRLPVGLGVGEHPTDPDRQVVYPFYSTAQQDQLSDTVPGGSLDYYSHGSILDVDPAIGNLLFLADNTWIDGLDITGFGIGVLVTPPETETATGTPGDFDGDDLLTAADINLLSAQVGQSDLTFDLNSDGSVTSADRDEWITLAGTLFGDTDLDGSVAFADFLGLSASFGQAGGWENGDFDGSGDVQFPDFLLLSSNFGESAAASAVPEPSCHALALLALLGLMTLRRRS